MRRIISILLMLVIAFGLCACVGDNTTSSDQLIGTWAAGDALWFFDDNGELRILYQGYFPGANPENYSIGEDIYNYSVDGNMLTFYNGAKDDVDAMYNRLIKFSGNNNLTLTNPEYSDDVLQLSRVKASNDANKTIIGTWIPFGYESFNLHVGTVGYGPVEQLSFYNDGTFRTITQAGNSFGEYKFLFDGEVLQMQGNGGRGELEYQLFGDEFMLLEFSIYRGEMQFSYLLKKEK